MPTAIPGITNSSLGLGGCSDTSGEYDSVGHELACAYIALGSRRVRSLEPDSALSNQHRPIRSPVRRLSRGVNVLTLL